MQLWVTPPPPPRMAQIADAHTKFYSSSKTCGRARLLSRCVSVWVMTAMVLCRRYMPSVLRVGTGTSKEVIGKDLDLESNVNVLLSMEPRAIKAKCDKKKERLDELDRKVRARGAASAFRRRPRMLIGSRACEHTAARKIRSLRAFAHRGYGGGLVGFSSRKDSGSGPLC
jgi:hypothetical protein